MVNSFSLPFIYPCIPSHLAIRKQTHFWLVLLVQPVVSRVSLPYVLNLSTPFCFHSWSPSLDLHDPRLVQQTQSANLTPGAAPTSPHRINQETWTTDPVPTHLLPMDQTSLFCLAFRAFSNLVPNLPLWPSLHAWSVLDLETLFMLNTLWLCCLPWISNYLPLVL